MRCLFPIFLFLGMAGTAAAESDIAFHDCPFGAIDGLQAACADLTVPESRNGNNAIQLRLPFVIFRPAEPSTLPPVLMLNGGPGGLIDIHRRDGLLSWMKYARGFQRNGPREVILFTQRGTDNEHGKALACDALQAPEILIGAVNVQSKKTVIQESFHTALKQCRDGAIAAGHDLRAYSTFESVRDIGALKKALRIEQWIIYGVSYGSRLALEVARHDSAGITGLILDSPSPPGAGADSMGAGVLGHSLKSLTEICKALWRCRALSQNIYKDTLRRINKLEEKPLKLSLRSPDNDQRYDVEMDGAAFSQLLFLAFYHPATIEEIPRILAQLRRGNREPLKRLVTVLQLKKRAIHIGTYASVHCQDRDPEKTLAFLRAERREWPEFEALIEEQISLNETLCPGWFENWTPDFYPEAVSGTVRTLILAGSLDPVTPVQSAEFLGKSLANATVKIYPDASHGILEFLPCAWEDVDAFLQGKPPVTTPACRRHYSF